MRLDSLMYRTADAFQFSISMSLNLVSSSQLSSGLLEEIWSYVHSHRPAYTILALISFRNLYYKIDSF